MTLYAHCNNGCGRRTTVGDTRQAICPHCGEPGIVILDSTDTAKSTTGYTTGGVPVAGQGTPFNRSQSDMANVGSFLSTRGSARKQ